MPPAPASSNISRALFATWEVLPPYRTQNTNKKPSDPFSEAPAPLFMHQKNKNTFPLRKRDNLLQTKPKETKEEMEEKLLFAITTFFPNYPILKSSILDVWDLMGKSPTTNHLFDKRIICGNRRLKNLPDLTVRAGLPKTGHALVTNPQTEHTPCLNPNRCRYCPKLDHSGHISCPST